MLMQLSFSSFVLGQHAYLWRGERRKDGGVELLLGICEHGQSSAGSYQLFSTLTH